MKNLLLLSLFIAFFYSCKTREDIAREKLVNTLNGQVKDSQKLNANFTVRLQELEARLSDLSGQTEESKYQVQTSVDERLKMLLERLTVLEENQKQLQEQAKQQEQYTSEVLKNLKSLTSKKKGKSSKKLSLYDSAMSDYKRGRYDAAFASLQKLLKTKSIKGQRRARVMHNLGMISYIKKNNTDALTYFSKLFTEMPKSSYNRNGLLFLAKTFKRLGQEAEMKQTLNELVNSWPKAKQVKEAKKLLR